MINLNAGNLLKSVLMFAVAGSCCIQLKALSPEEKEKAVETAKKSCKSLVRIEGTVSLEISGLGSQTEKNEQEINTHGTIVDSSGLTAVPYIFFNPESMLRQRMPGIQIKANVSKLKMTLDDGSTVEARIVLEDPLTGFAFLRPVDLDAEKTFEAVDFANAATPGVLDEVLSLMPLGKNMKYEKAVSLGIISAKVEKPRLIYAVSGIDAYPAMPVYLPVGKPVGLLTLRGDNAGENGGLSLIAGADIVDLVKQALAAPIPQATAEEEVSDPADDASDDRPLPEQVEKD